MPFVSSALGLWDTNTETRGSKNKFTLMMKTHLEFKFLIKNISSQDFLMKNNAWRSS